MVPVTAPGVEEEEEEGTKRIQSKSPPKQKPRLKESAQKEAAARNLSLRDLAVHLRRGKSSGYRRPEYETSSGGVVNATDDQNERTYVLLSKVFQEERTSCKGGRSVFRPPSPRIGLAGAAKTSRRPPAGCCKKAAAETINQTHSSSGKTLFQSIDRFTHKTRNMSSTFLSNLFDPSVVDPSYTEEPPQPPPILINVTPKITDILFDSSNESGIISIINNSSGGGGSNNSSNNDFDDKTREYEHDVYFVLVVVTVSLTVFTMVVFSIYRIIESVMEGRANCGGGGRCRHRTESGAETATANATTPQQQQSNTPGDGSGGGSSMRRANSGEFLSSEFPVSLLLCTTCYAEQVVLSEYRMWL